MANREKKEKLEYLDSLDQLDGMDGLASEDSPDLLDLKGTLERTDSKEKSVFLAPKGTREQRATWDHLEVLDQEDRGERLVQLDHPERRGHQD